MASCRSLSTDENLRMLDDDHIEEAISDISDDEYLPDQVSDSSSIASEDEPQTQNEENDEAGANKTYKISPSGEKWY